MSKPELSEVVDALYHLHCRPSCADTEERARAKLTQYNDLVKWAAGLVKEGELALLVDLVLKRLPGAELRHDVIWRGDGLPEISVQLPDRHVIWDERPGFRPGFKKLDPAAKAGVEFHRDTAGHKARRYNYRFRDCLVTVAGVAVGRVHVHVTVNHWRITGMRSCRVAIHGAISDELVKALTSAGPGEAAPSGSQRG